MTILNLLPNANNNDCLPRTTENNEIYRRPIKFIPLFFIFQICRPGRKSPSPQTLRPTNRSPGSGRHPPAPGRLLGSLGMINMRPGGKSTHGFAHSCIKHLKIGCNQLGSRLRGFGFAITASYFCCSYYETTGLQLEYQTMKLPRL